MPESGEIDSRCRVVCAPVAAAEGDQIARLHSGKVDLCKFKFCRFCFQPLKQFGFACPLGCSGSSAVTCLRN